MFDTNWDEERVGIFEPIPFKGDENMTVDATNRPIFDDEDQERETYTANGQENGTGSK